MRQPIRESIEIFFRLRRDSFCASIRNFLTTAQSLLSIAGVLKGLSVDSEKLYVLGPNRSVRHLLRLPWPMSAEIRCDPLFIIIANGSRVNSCLLPPEVISFG